MKDQVTLKQFDYVDIKDIESPEQSTAIADAFISAGAEPGIGYPYADGGYYWGNMFWDNDNRVNRGIAGDRRLTPQQVLTATNARGQSTIGGSQSPAWDGEGLPPVGVECEVAMHGGRWDRCTVLAETEKNLVLCLHDDGDREALCPKGNRFRPIRSKEDRAVDEMRTIYMQHVDGIRAIYRAGYRKVDS